MTPRRLLLVAFAAAAIVAAVFYRTTAPPPDGNARPADSPSRRVDAPPPPPPPLVDHPPSPYVLDERPPLLRHADLVRLSADRNDPQVVDRADRLLTTPFINNEANARGDSPHRPSDDELGPLLRVVSWNVERGLELDGIVTLFSDIGDFLELRDPDALEAEEYGEVAREAHLLQTADIVVLQEVDWGLKRSGYRAVPEELGRRLGMNWTFGIQFLEVDPFQLGTETFEGMEGDAADRAELAERIAVEPDRYRGLHGSAVLSRYPIESVRLIRLEHQGYDWYTEEKEGPSFFEGLRREAVEQAFLTTIGRQIRVGGRILLLVDLVVPGAGPDDRVTVAAAHLEDRTTPEGRQLQLDEMLSHIGPIARPVILAGDMNTSGKDGTPTDWRRELTKRVGDGEFWATTVLKHASGLGIFATLADVGTGFVRTHTDPTVEDIPLIAENDAEAFFEALEQFRFDDGYAFDFRGDASRSHDGHEGTLANSNERDTRGFVATFEVERPLGPVGKMKLDWMFVKAYARSPRDTAESYRFAPHRGRTLDVVVKSVPGRLSDHSPIVVDLPFDAE